MICARCSWPWSTPTSARATVKAIAEQCEKLFPHCRLAHQPRAGHPADALPQGRHLRQAGPRQAARRPAGQQGRPAAADSLLLLPALAPGWLDAGAEAPPCRLVQRHPDLDRRAQLHALPGEHLPRVPGGVTVADRKAILSKGDQMPLAVLVLAQRLQTDRQPELLAALRAAVRTPGQGGQAPPDRRIAASGRRCADPDGPGASDGAEAGPTSSRACSRPTRWCSST